MRSSTATGYGLLSIGIVAAVLVVIALYRWDSTARAAEAALRPVPVAPLAAAPIPATATPVATPAPLAITTSLTGDAFAGKSQFASACNSCHPSANAGIGPALYGPQFAARYPEDAQLAAVIRDGKGGMPAFNTSQVSDQQLADLVAYLRGLGSGAIAVEPTPTPRPRQRGG